MLNNFKPGTLVKLSAYGLKLDKYSYIPTDLVGIVIMQPYGDWHRVRLSNGRQCMIDRRSLKKVR